MKHEKTVNLYQDGIGKVQYIDHMGSDLTIVNSARVSFGVEKEELDDRDKKLVNYLVKHRHTSTFEHNVVTFKFVVPLFVRSQHMRHRTWSYNEISRRYTDKDLAFYCPNAFRTQHKSNRQSSNNDEIDPILYPDLSDPSFGLTCADYLKQHTRMAKELFENLMSAGVCREQARMVLPQNMMTEWYWSGSLYAFARVCNLRLKEDTQSETRDVVTHIEQVMRDQFPVSSQCLLDN